MKKTFIFLVVATIETAIFDRGFREIQTEEMEGEIAIFANSLSRALEQVKGSAVSVKQSGAWHKLN